MSKIFGASLAFFSALIAAAPALAATTPAFEAPRSAVHQVKNGERAYNLYVALPPGYLRPENADRAYPVIYLNDGDLFFQAAAGAPLLSYYNGVLEEVVVVGVSYAIGEDPIASRQLDLTPVVDEQFSNATGGADRYLSLFKSGIIPLIESEYRIDAKRRTLAGHSFGAVFGLYCLLTAPDLFANYILVSPSLWYGDRAIARLESLYAQTHSDLPARVYLAVGDLEGPNGGLRAVDMVNDEIAFAARLQSRSYKSLQIKQETLEGGVNHSTAFNAAYLRSLEWFFAVN